MLSFVAAAYSTSRPTPFFAAFDGSLSFSPCTAPQPSLFAFCTIATLSPASISVAAPSMESWDGKTAPVDTPFTAVEVAAPSSPCSSPSSAAPSLRSSPSSSSLASTAVSSLFSAAESTSSRSSTPEPVDLSALDCPPSPRPASPARFSTLPAHARLPTFIGLGVSPLAPVKPFRPVVPKPENRLVVRRIFRFGALAPSLVSATLSPYSHQRLAAVSVLPRRLIPQARKPWRR
ncbi:hypothetical protein JCM10207_006710 [Rhodosporidiobolus poonsookiae]